ncbi:corrinoid protein [Candidatus Sumerlaeota bacterium]|nr:corrinoid protein [Candidatus Sumerlaeota bacterium]
MVELSLIAENVICGHVNANSNYPPEKKGQPGVEELVKQALDDGMSPHDVLNKGLIAGMDVVGKKFKSGEYFVPEVLISAKAMKSGMELLRPLLVKSGVEPKGVVVLGTVEGDMHDIGKNLVGMMLEGAGFQIIDLGVNVPAQKFVEIAQQHPDAVVGMSALLTITMEKMGSTLEALRSAGASNKVIVGGAPVDETFAERIGADGYSPDAASAVPLVKQLVGVQ